MTKKIGRREIYLLGATDLGDESKRYMWTDYERVINDENHRRRVEEAYLLERKGYSFLEDENGNLSDNPFIVTPSGIIMSPLVVYCINKSGKQILETGLAKEVLESVEYYETYDPEFFDCMKTCEIVRIESVED